MDSTLRTAVGHDLPRPGDVICGKYRIDSIVGTGGMGIVMGGVDTSLGRPVAIKFLSPHKAQRDGAIQRFLREARSAAAIQSENVVRVFEVSTLPNGAPFIVMEHLRGLDLSQLLTQRGRLSVPEACDYVLQTCEALAEAHARGIVHRDLKPQNLFLTQRPDGAPCVKVLDFGISKVGDDGTGQTNLTSTDMVMGTPLYMSPEQVRSLKNVDSRADIWALGSILFELLTMSPIFQAPSASALCAMIAMDPPTPLRARRPDAPPELEAVILRCLHKDPAGRFQDVGALAEALAPFSSERGRLSVTRITNVVRNRTGQPLGSDPMVAQAQGFGSFPPSPMGIQAAQYATTGTSNHPSFAPSISNLPPAMHGSMHPPGGPHPTTQSTWQQTGPAQQPRTSGVLVAILGVLTGLVLLGVVGGGAWWYLAKQDASAAEASNPAEAGALEAGAPAVQVTATAVVSSVPTTPSSTSTSQPHPQPAKHKDAGAPPSPQVDGGAPVPPPPKPPTPDADEIAAKKRLAEGRCNHHRFLLSSGPDRKKAAQQVKTMVCLQATSMSSNSGAANCDRVTCRQACAVLDDQMCLRQLDFADRSNPLPF